MGMRLLVPAAAALALAGCATTHPVRMHSQEELAGIARGCGVALGDIAQFEEEPRLVFLMQVQNFPQFRCVRRWAKRQRLQLVYIEGAELIEEPEAQ